MSHQIGAFDSLVPAPKDGESPKILELSPPLIAHPIDSTTKKTIGEHTYCVYARLLQDNEALEFSNDYDCTTSSVANVYIQVGTYFMIRSFQIWITIPEGIEKSSPIDVVTVTISHKDGLSVSSTLTISYVQRGLIGKTGPLPKPCGYWDVNVDYTIKNNMPPLVMYPKSANGLYYLRTENPIRYKSDKKTPMDPAADYATYGGAGAWLLMEGYDALYAHFLMADWARFGNAEGGVFWAHYLFSALGVPKGGGEAVDYSVYADSDTPIFDEVTRRLTGMYTPNLFLDFKYGELKCNRISEPFVRMSGNFKKISLQESHNVCIEATTRLANNTIKSNLPKILFMPNPADIVTYRGTVLVDTPFLVDGTNSCILLQSNNGVQSLKSSMTWGGGGNYDIRRFITILCADGRISDPHSYREHQNGSIGYYPDKGYTSQGVVQRYSDVPEGYFYVNGMFTKFLLLAPGDMVRLKSCYIPYTTNDGRGTIDVLAWFVENSENFGNIPLALTMNVLQYYDDASEDELLDCDEEVLFNCTSTSESFYGLHTAYGSKFLVGKKGGSALDITFILEDADTIGPQDF